MRTLFRKMKKIRSAYLIMSMIFDYVWLIVMKKIHSQITIMIFFLIIC